MKKLKLFMTALIAAITVAGMSSVSAAGSIKPTSEQNLKITRTIDNAKNAITNTFTYKITAQGTQTGVTGAPTTTGVSFNSTTPSGGTAKAYGTIDMTGITFAKNGDFSWLVEENGTGDDVNYPVDSTNKYTITASVRNTASSNLSNDQAKKVIITVKKVGESEKLNLTDNPEAFLFTSQTAYKHIEISKEVTGNMADVDQCFDVSVTVGTTGQSYTVSGGCAETPTTIEGGKATTIKLKHGDTVKIGTNGTIDEIPVNTAYSYTETVPTGYTATNGTLEDGKVDADQTKNNKKITNNYETTPITGAFLNVLPYVVIVALAVAGVVYLVIRNKKQEKEITE